MPGRILTASRGILEALVVRQSVPSAASAEGLLRRHHFIFCRSSSFVGAYGELSAADGNPRHPGPA